MLQEFQQFTTIRPSLSGANLHYLEKFLAKLAPGAQFRFITFQENDFKLGNLTYQLYNYIPETVFATVQSPADIEPGIEALFLLNPSVEWNVGQIDYLNKGKDGQNRVSIELRLTVIPMSVSATGNYYLYNG